MSKNKKTEHPERAELIAAASTSRHSLGKHLKDCSECRELYELLRATRVYRGLVEEPAEDGLVARCAAIPAMERSSSRVPVKSGRIAHDSWSELPAAALRDIDQGGERRLCLYFGPHRLELVAQRTGTGWQMSARLSSLSDLDGLVYVLKVGSRKIASGDHRMFVWSDRRPPHSIELIGPGERFACRAIDWRGAAGR